MNSTDIRRFRDDFHTLASRAPEDVALVDASSGRTLTWVELDTLTGKLGRWLSEIGFVPGDVLLSLLPNSIEAISLFFACMRHGFGYAPLPPSASSREISRLRGLLPIKHVIALAAADERINQALADIPATRPHLDLQFAWADNDGAMPPLHDHAGQLYIATSGSTGEPKVMRIDGDKLWSAGVAFAAHHGFLTDSSRFYNIMPMSYLGGLFNLGMIPLACRGSVVISSAFSGSTIMRFWHEVSLHHVNVLWLVPTMIRALIKVTAPRWKLAATNIKVTASFLGTAPIDLATKQEFEELFGIPLLENFALSETTFLTSESLSSRLQRSAGSVGEVLPWVDIRLVKAGGGLPTGIQVRTPFLFEGYIGTNGVQPPADMEGWFETGDLGHFEDSRLVLDGRSRDVIKKGGILIYLAEIELLARQAEAVADVAAVDVPHDFYGEDYVLFLVFKPDAAGSESERIERFRAFLSDNLVSTKYPLHIIALNEISRTSSGKIARPVLRELATKGTPS